MTDEAADRTNGVASERSSVASERSSAASDAAGIAASDAVGVAAAAEGRTTDRIVVRDKRRVDPATGAPRSGSRPAAAGPAAAERSGAAADGAAGPPSTAETVPAAETAPAQAAAPETTAAAAADATTADATTADATAADATAAEGGTAGGGPAGKSTGKAGAAAPAVEDTEAADADAAVAETPADAGTAVGEGVPLGAELEALRAELDERTKDLQRVTAEYANYRKRVDRDRALVVEQATGLVLASLLPVLDDLDRARDHGDLVGPFGAVAEKLIAALGKFGLTAFGETGDPFDPTRHEAVAHQTSSEVTEPTCIDVLRRGYLLGERLLRPALVAVADPE